MRRRRLAMQDEEIRDPNGPGRFLKADEIPKVSFPALRRKTNRLHLTATERK